jgi:hypothetical protein
MLVLCKHCAMTVRAGSPVCRRCRRAWPGAYALRRKALEALAFAALAASTGMVWVMAYARW